MSELLENLKKLRNNGSRKQAHIDLACRCINEVEKLEGDLKLAKENHKLAEKSVKFWITKYNELEEKNRL